MTQRPVHTCSIIARDPATGEFGAAIQSHWFTKREAERAVVLADMVRKTVMKELVREGLKISVGVKTTGRR